MSCRRMGESADARRERFRQPRRLMMPMFSRTSLAAPSAAVAQEMARRIARWDRFAETGPHAARLVAVQLDTAADDCGR